MFKTLLEDVMLRLRMAFHSPEAEMDEDCDGDQASRSMTFAEFKAAVGSKDDTVFRDCLK